MDRKQMTKAQALNMLLEAHTYAAYRGAFRALPDAAIDTMQEAMAILGRLDLTEPPTDQPCADCPPGETQRRPT